jgi:hypothetical protein
MIDLQNIIKDIDVSMTNNTAKYMCTLNCTCPYDTDFNLWDENQLRAYNRTKGNSFSANGTTYRTMVKSATNPGPFTYNSFWECYEAVQALPGFAEEDKIDDGTKKLIETIEEEF